MFDTGQAARVLKLPAKGLAYLLQHYCGVTADKTLQRADWRARPLPDEMLKYAREDTHYLLYIYDCLRKQLKEAGTAHNPENSLLFFKDVLHRSTSLCLKVYEKPEAKGFDYFRTVSNSRHITGINKLRVLKMILKWRDYIARIDDESLGYILPNHILFQIVQDLPTTRNELRDCRRASAEPPAIQKYGE